MHKDWQSHYGLIKVSGIDAEKFLQGQFTCDVASVTHGEHCLGAHCNPKGRIISLFRLFYFQNAYYLLLPRNMVAIAEAALKKYAIFFKSEISDASDTLAIAGFMDTPQDQITATHNLICLKIQSRLPRYLLIGDFDTVNKYSAQPGKISAESWHNLDIRDGIPAVYPATSTLFLPHELNLHELNAISFNKGCYTGQEIIARMHYRGKLKTHLYQASINRSSAPAPGTDVLYQDKVVGKVVDACPEEYNQYNTLLIIDEMHAASTELTLEDDKQTHFIMHSEYMRDTK